MVNCKCNVFIRPTLKNAIVYSVMGLSFFLLKILFFDKDNEKGFIINIISVFLLNISFYIFLFSFILQKAQGNFRNRICCFYNFLNFFNFYKLYCDNFKKLVIEK